MKRTPRPFDAASIGQQMLGFDDRSACYGDLVTTRIPPPVLAFLTAALMWLVDRQWPQLRFDGWGWVIVGWSLMAIGIAFDIVAMVFFIQARTTINPMRPDRASRLVVSGMYRISRNPMYLGLVFSLCGWALALRNPFCLVFVAGFVRILVIVQIAPEEIALRRRFGDKYIEYSRQVNRWLGRKIV
jgi:protein-S-isoprenylcysteine O-methyltransferase Ste14